MSRHVCGRFACLVDSNGSSNFLCYLCSAFLLFFFVNFLTKVYIRRFYCTERLSAENLASRSGMPRHHPALYISTSARLHIDMFSPTLSTTHPLVLFIMPQCRPFGSSERQDTLERISCSQCFWVPRDFAPTPWPRTTAPSDECCWNTLLRELEARAGHTRPDKANKRDGEVAVRMMRVIFLFYYPCFSFTANGL